MKCIPNPIGCHGRLDRQRPRPAPSTGGRAVRATRRGVPTHPQRPTMYRAMQGTMKNIQIPIL
jgi:hypothetical protein